MFHKINVFQYAVAVALNYEEIKEDPQRRAKMKPFINKYDWEGISYPSEKDDQKKNLRKNFGKNNVTIPLNVLHAKKKRKNYILFMFQKITQIVKKKLILLKILNGETMALSCSQKTICIIKREEYLLTTMVIVIVSITFILLQPKKKKNFNHMKASVKIIEFCYIVIPSEFTKILEFNQYQKSDKVPFIIYADLECKILMDVKIFLKICLQRK